MDKIPAASYMLVVFMSLVATLIVNYLFDAGGYLTLSAFPALMFSGLAGNAVLIINGIILSHDRAANTALSTCFGFILLATTIFACLHVWYRLNDQPRT